MTNQSLIQKYLDTCGSEDSNVVAIRLACFAVAVAGIFATVRIAFDG
jgi:hypothetical protein